MSTTVTEETVAEAPVETPWEGPLGLEGYATSDKRYLIPGEIGERDFPLPLRVQMQTSAEGGHANAVNVGRIETIARVPMTEFDRREEFGMQDLPDTATVIWGEGYFAGDPAEIERARTMMDNGSGISLDLPPERHGLFDPETLEEVDPETASLEDVLSGAYLTGIGGKIAGATIVDIPAFEHAAIRVVDGDVMVAAALKEPRFDLSLPYIGGFTIREGLSEKVSLTQEQIDEAALGIVTLTAAAFKKPPSQKWFEDPQLSGPTPMTYTADGRVYGHLALWDSCHIGYTVCTNPPHSMSNYDYFNVGLIDTDKGPVTVGKLMFSMDGGKHASLEASAAEASRHYDDSSKVGAFVRAGEDAYGIWLAGALRPGLSKAELQHMKSHPPSGDWRPIRQGSELIAAFSVAIPGFPIPHAELRMVASGGREEVAAMILSPPDFGYRGRRRKMKALSLRRHRDSR